MDRAQHQRYLVYLKKYEYFGRGKPRLDLNTFEATEAEMAALDGAGPTGEPRRREIEALLLRD